MIKHKTIFNFRFIQLISEFCLKKGAYSKRNILILLLLFFFQAGFAIENPYLLTVRKSGTHLASRLLDLLEIPHHTGHVLHLSDVEMFCSSKTAKGIVLIRDPRDVCVSGTYWRTNLWVDQGPHGLKLNGKEMLLDLNQLQMWNDASFDQKLMGTIEHELPLPYSQINLEYQIVEEILESKHSDCFLLKFEDIIGSKGGGSDQVQYETIKSILNFLNLEVSEDKIRKAQKNLFGISNTFRKGKMNEWQNHFKPCHIELFKKKMNKVLLNFGYENEFDWDSK